MDSRGLYHKPIQDKEYWVTEKGLDKVEYLRKEVDPTGRRFDSLILEALLDDPMSKDELRRRYDFLPGSKNRIGLFLDLYEREGYLEKR